MGGLHSLDRANSRPSELIATETLSGLRHYMHTLMRVERSNRMDGYLSPICYAIESGALGLVSRRLESDHSLYETPSNNHSHTS